jgi:imidazolonepropionase-like amidohydrolase
MSLSRFRYEPEVSIPVFTSAASSAVVEPGPFRSLAVHAYTTKAVRRAVEAGVKCIDHGQFLDVQARVGHVRCSPESNSSPQQTWMRDNSRFVHRPYIPDGPPPLPKAE